MNIFKLIWPDFPNIAHINFDIARPEDAENIGRLSRELVETGMKGWSWHPKRVLAQIQNVNALVIVGRAKDKVIAAAIMEFGHYSAHLSLLMVKRHYQGIGIGRCLVHFLENVAALKEIASVTLEVRKDNSFARDFYQALGYREIDTVPAYYSDNHAAIRMTRHPGPPQKVAPGG